MRDTPYRVSWRRVAVRTLAGTGVGLALSYGTLWLSRVSVRVTGLVAGSIALPVLLALMFYVDERKRPRPAPPEPVAPVTTSPEARDPLMVAAPSGSGYFVGRSEELEEIRRLLAEAAAGGRLGVVELSGPPGIGKTTLAERYAVVVAADYDAVLRADLEHATLLEAQATLLAQLPRGRAEELPSRAEDRKALYRRLIDEGRYLVLLDEVADAEQLRELIPGHPESAVLLVSRRTLEAAPITGTLQVPSLYEDDAIALIRQIVGPERADAEPAAAEEIAVLCGYMPLALTIAGSLLALRPYWSLESFAGRLRDDRFRLDELQVGDIEVRKSLAVSYQGLYLLERKAFRRLALWEPDTFAPWVLSPLLDVSVEEADRIAESLARASLLKRVDRDPPRYGMHDLVKCYAKETLDKEDPPHGPAIERVAKAYLLLIAHVFESCHGPREVSRSGTDDGGTDARGPGLEVFGPLDRGLPVAAHLDAVVGARPAHWLAAESHALEAVFDLAGQAGLNRLCWQLALATLPFFELLRSVWGRWVMPPVSAELVEDEERSERGAADVRVGAAIHRIKGALLMSADDFHQAEDEFRSAAELYVQVGDDIGYADSVRGLGESLRMLGRYAESVDALEEALEFSLRAGDVPGRAKALLDLGNCHRIAHLDELAQSELEQALELNAAAGDHFERARTLRALGNLHRQRGKPAAAETALVEAMRVFETFEARPGDSYWVACTRYSLGKLLRDQGRPDEAADEFEGARLAFGDGPGSRLWRGRLDRQLALVLTADGKHLDEAEAYALSALRQFEGLGGDFWVAHARHTLGRVLAVRPDRGEDARRELQLATDLYTKVGNSWYAADASAHLASILPKDRVTDAIRLMRAAVGTFGQFEDRRRQLEALKDLEGLETLESDHRGRRRRTLMSAPPAPDPTDHRIAS